MEWNSQCRAPCSTEPFTLGEQRGIAVTVNTLVVKTHLCKGCGYGKTGRVEGGALRLMEAAVGPRLIHQ